MLLPKLSPSFDALFQKRERKSYRALRIYYTTSSFLSSAEQLGKMIALKYSMKPFLPWATATVSSFQEKQVWYLKTHVAARFKRTCSTAQQRAYRGNVHINAYEINPYRESHARTFLSIPTNMLYAYLIVRLGTGSQAAHPSNSEPWIPDSATG